MQRLKFAQSIPKSDLPCGQFTPVASAGLMIKIVRLSVGQIACFKHFQLHKCSDRLDVIQGQPVKDGGALACAREKNLKLPDILGWQSAASQ
jgi:hypothetical protein